MTARIRFVQVDVPYDTIHGPDGKRGFPVPIEDDGLTWEPFQVEFRGTPAVGHTRYSHVRLAIWMRAVE